MATVILRPTDTTTEAGWDTSEMHQVLGDNDEGTGGTQNNTTCHFQGALADLDENLYGATINNFNISLRGNAGRAGTAEVAISLVHESDGAFASETETFGALAITHTTTNFTTQQDGSSNLTYDYINNCSVKIIPNDQGITAYELYVTVEYTLGDRGGNIVLKSGKIQLTSGKITL